MEENAIVAFRNTMELNFDGLGSEKKKTAECAARWKRRYIFQSSPLKHFSRFDVESVLYAPSESWMFNWSRVTKYVVQSLCGAQSQQWNMCRKLITILIVLQGAVGSLQIQFTNSFGHCLKQDKPDILRCAGQQAIETLQQLSDENNFTLADGVVVVKDESVMGRNSPLNFLDQDPNDFR